MKWFGAIEFAREGGVVRCTQSPIVTLVTDLACCEGLTEESLAKMGYRLVRREPVIRAARYAKWWIAWVLRAKEWCVDAFWVAVISALPYGIIRRWEGQSLSMKFWRWRFRR